MDGEPKRRGDMAASHLGTQTPAAPRPRTVKGLIRWAWHSWATRSLALGGVATVLDVCVLLTAVKVLKLPNPVGAMCGVCVGATFTFFANKYFAFRDHHPNLAPQALKFALATGGAMLVHAGVVWELADHLHVNVVLAKLLADIAVFSVGQLFLLRYLVFPKAAEGAARPARSAPKLESLRETESV